MGKRPKYTLTISGRDRNMLIRLLRWNEGGPFFRHSEEWCWRMVDKLRSLENDQEEGRRDGR